MRQKSVSLPPKAGELASLTWLLLFLHVSVFISFKSEQINILTPTEICIMEAVYFIGDRTSAH